MAKLNGITVLGLVSGEVIVNNGQHYSASTSTGRRSTAVGDIIRFSAGNYSNMTVGEYYLVNRVDGSGDGHVANNVGRDFDLCGERFVVFKPLKTSVSPTTSFTEVGREANVGDRIKIVNAYGTGGLYKDGDVLIVSRTTRNVVFANSVDSAKKAIGNSEYVVLEPVAVVTPHVFQSGDVVRSKSTSTTYTLADRKPQFDGAGYGTSWGIVGNTGYIGESQFTLVTPVSPSALSEYHVIGKVVYRKESRKAGVGELIVVTKTDYERNQFFNVGDIAKVTSMTHDGITCDFSGQGNGFVDDGGKWLVSPSNGKSEYAVLTPISEAIVHDGIPYRTVKRTAVAGELVVFTDADNVGHYGTRQGAVYTVEKINRAGDLAHFMDGGAVFHHRYSVMEPLTSTSTSTPVLPAPVFAVGDTVKLTIAAGKYPEHGYGDHVKNGDIGIVKMVKPDPSGLQVDFPKHNRWNGLVSEFTLAPKPRLAVGSYAKIVVANTGQNSVIPSGTIVEIIKDDSSDVPFLMRTLDGKTERWALESHIVAATQTEIDDANAKRLADLKTAAETALWAAIGRRVNEYKNGDIVKVVKTNNGHPVGTIGTVLYGDDKGGARLNALRPDGRILDLWSPVVEMVTPVESVFTK